MERKRTIATLVAAGLLLALLAGLALAQESTLQASVFNGFTYQGRLLDDGSPADGEYEAQFRLYDVSYGGTPLASINEDLYISDGLFTVRLLFGSQYFSGDARYLEIALRPVGSPDPYTTLTPRQQLTPAPYALHALSNWSLTGNASIDPHANFLGTTDQVSLTLAVSNTAALRLEPAYDDVWHTYSPNLIGGDAANSVADGAAGATIGGGGIYNQANAVYDNYGTVGGGLYNRAGSDDGTTTNALVATVAGGRDNQATAEFATVSGGLGNVADGVGGTVGGGSGNHAGSIATVGGGYQNDASGNAATIGGGSANNVSLWTYQSTIGGGYGNSVTADNGTVAGGGCSDPDDDTTGNRVTDEYGTVGGGGDNQAGDGDAIYDDATYATVGGGLSNTANGHYATVPGGRDNVAFGNHSFAAGQRARAIYEGSFVWNDSTASYLDSETADQWLTRASGGYYLWTSDSTGVYVAGGGGSWSSLCDRNLKENVDAVEPQEVLEQVAALPISTWNYTTEDAAIRHMGPMAQDFYAAFELGDSERHINTLDADGVALAAIQGLYLENRELQSQVKVLEARLSALEKATNTSTPAGPGGWWLVGGLVVIGCVLVQRRAGGQR